MAEEDPERLASRAPGADPEDPYADVDVDSLPEWWRRAIEEFEAHDLRPYRPPRLADGTLLHEVVETLEADLGAEITFGSVGTDYRERWEVRVDGDVVGTVGRRRSVEGYTVYEVDANGLETMIREA